MQELKKRHLSDSNTRGQRPTALLLAGDPVNHSGKVTVDFLGLHPFINTMELAWATTLQQ